MYSKWKLTSSFASVSCLSKWCVFFTKALIWSFLNVSFSIDSLIFLWNASHCDCSCCKSLLSAEKEKSCHSLVVHFICLYTASYRWREAAEWHQILYFIQFNLKEIVLQCSVCFNLFICIMSICVFTSRGWLSNVFHMRHLQKCYNFEK